MIKSFGQRVRCIRKQLHFSQKKLGSVCGLHRTHISEIERGAKSVSLVSVVKLARGLEISPAELFAPPTPPTPPVEATPVCPPLVRALTLGWKEQCLAYAEQRAEFTVIFTEEEDIPVIKAIALRYRYAAVNLENAVALIPLNRPPVQIVGATRRNARGSLN